MDMYVHMFDEMRRSESDNPTIDIVLCSETDHNIARYSILKGNGQLFPQSTSFFCRLKKNYELRLSVKRKFYEFSSVKMQEVLSYYRWQENIHGNIEERILIILY
jgi:hypothetical protein